MRHTFPMLLLLLALPMTAHAGTPDVELVSPCLREGDTVRCWGDGGSGLSLAAIPHLAGARDLVPTRHGVCGTRNKTVVCLDERDLPEPGEAVKLATEGSLRPDELLKVTQSLSGVTATAVSQETVCVLHRNGQVSCISEDTHSIPGVTARRELTRLDVKGVRAVSVFARQVCVADADGVLCGGLGARATFESTPTPVLGLPPSVQAAVDGSRACAVDREGALRVTVQPREKPDHLDHLGSGLSITFGWGIDRRITV